MTVCNRNGTIINKSIKLATFVAVIGTLVACGGDSESPSKVADKDDGREVATVVDLGRCTSEREGDTVYVAEKMKDYLCRKRSWVDLSEVSSNEQSLSSSSDVTDKTSEASGKSSSSSVASNTSSATSNASKVSSSSNKTDSPENFIRENISVTGVAQKGPFKFGSPLNLYELKNDLTPSGRVYKDEINSNKGDFVIPKVSLAYPYAKLEVRGLYRNEVNGEWSKDSMTLRALTDFSDKRTEANSNDRVQVNINLLTHLEYDRALYLVQNKGYSVFAAKKQAAQEIMTAFEFATAVTYSEDFAIFQNDGVGSGTIAGNGTLLAISALVMGNRSDDEIQSVVDKFREDIKTDGEWNDLQTKADMADWASGFKYDNIRASVKSWNILDIPDYETYLDVYWNNVYGLGGCSINRKDVVAPNSNKLSKYYGSYFTCKLNGAKYSWQAATTYEKDTYGWSKGKSGEFKKGDVTDSIYIFNGTKWEFSEIETAIGLCQKNNAGVVSVFNNIHYICRDNAWEKATMLEFDTYGLTGVEGDVKVGVVNKNKYYVYKDGKWQSATSIEKDLGGCVASREGEVGKSGDFYYTCKSKTWASATSIEKDLGGCVASREGEVSKSGEYYYICKSKTWAEATVLEYDTYGLTGVEGDVKVGVVNKNKYYVYKDGKWQSATSIEKDLGVCAASREGEVGKSGNSYYICKSEAWVRATALEYDTYGLKCVEGEVRAGLVNKVWYYICKDGKWQTATTEEQALGGCTVSREGEFGVIGDFYFICKSKTWKNTTKIEYDLGECVASREGEVLKYEDSYYICKSNKWMEATVLEYDTYGKTCLTDGSIVDGEVDHLNKYVCDAGFFRMAKNLEKSLNKGCVSYTEGNKIRKEETSTLYSLYLCKNGLWENLEGIFEDSRDGKIYKTVLIGKQIWMGQNLNYKAANSYCYSDDTSFCSKYGRLYTWAAVMDSVGKWKTNGKGCGYGKTCSPTYPVRGICPTGWHLPTKDEFNTLFLSTRADLDGGVLKSTSGWNDYKGQSGNGADAYSFSALPAGAKSDLYFYNEGSSTSFWSSTEKSPNMTYDMNLKNSGVGASLGAGSKDFGYSVRCVKD